LSGHDLFPALPDTGPPSTAGFVFLDGLFLRGRRAPANLPVGRDLTIRRKIENGRYHCAFCRSNRTTSRSTRAVLKPPPRRRCTKPFMRIPIGRRCVSMSVGYQCRIRTEEKIAGCQPPPVSDPALRQMAWSIVQHVAALVNSGPKLAENQRFEIAARPHLAVDLLVANLSGTPCPVKAAAAEGGGQWPAFTGHGVPPNLATVIDAQTPHNRAISNRWF
jgi:hypothetical protein